MNGLADEIQVLRFPDNVRMRHGMYLNGRNHCLDEIIENSVDQFMVGNCTIIACEIHGREIRVEDNGAGIPVGPSHDPEHKGESQVEVAMCTLHAGGKFDQREGAKTGGLNGVGASAVNATSSDFEVQCRIGGKVYSTKFQKGIVTEHTHVVGSCPKEAHGTTTIFTLDDSIWTDDKLDVKRVARRMRQLAYLNPGLTMGVNFDTEDADGEPVKMQESYCYEDGVKAYVEKLTKGKTHITEPELVQAAVDGGEKIGSIDVQVAFAYTDAYTADIKSFVNNIATEYGGDHVTGLKEGVVRAVTRYAEEEKLVKNISDIKQNDAIEGLTAIVSVTVADPNYEGQGKNKIRMPQVRAAVKETISDFLFDYLSRDANRAKLIVGKAVEAAKARAAAKRARDAARGLNKAASSGTLPEKLADCSGTDPEKNEIYLVEGDSAGGSAKQGRDRRYQAILPIFGKVQNAEKTTRDKIYASVKTQDIVKALRCGIEDDYDESKLRYDKVILMSDADVDGAHIMCLHMTYFYRYMPQIIRNGHLYLACPPLFKVSKKGQPDRYLYTEAELEAADTEGCSIQRYKGLGEMNPEQLWETTMNPEKRRLIRITLEDAEHAEEMLSICMGTDVETRKQFIISRGQAA